MEGRDDLQDLEASVYPPSEHAEVHHSEGKGERTELTSTAPCTSLPVLHFANPSSVAPTASSTYFSKVRVAISLRMAGTLAVVWREERRRVRRAVCRFNEGSSLPREAVGRCTRGELLLY